MNEQKGSKDPKVGYRDLKNWLCLWKEREQELKENLLSN
jgi:hypothetical protein